MKKITIDIENNKSYNYDIVIDAGGLNRLAQYLEEIGKSKRFVIITDSIVNSLYAQNVYERLLNEGFHVSKVVIKAGESSKSLDQYNRIISYLLNNNISRSDVLLAVGGGVIGDLTGFVASSYLRGIEYIQIPTTLLAQVDSSVGGKVAINHEKGKNLMGAFYNPRLVIIDHLVLKTLDDRDFYSGLSECIKYAIALDKSLFYMIYRCTNRADIMESIDSIIHRCIELKKSVVKIDPYDQGYRFVLNFGHTIGHGLEKYFNYKRYTHGEAVSLGMYHITKYSYEKGYCSMTTLIKVREILENNNLPIVLPTIDPNRFLSILKNDKKIRKSKLKFVVVESIGSHRFEEIDVNKINELIRMEK